MSRGPWHCRQSCLPSAASAKVCSLSLVETWQAPHSPFFTGGWMICFLAYSSAWQDAQSPPGPAGALRTAAPVGSAKSSAQNAALICDGS